MKLYTNNLILKKINIYSYVITINSCNKIARKINKHTINKFCNNNNILCVIIDDNKYKLLFCDLMPRNINIKKCLLYYSINII